ncbi:MAG TPA: sialate O-acetylesterase [Arachidicoccus sp.]|nr:sialate O-acetylesterase [Arachidicoccus sp.]
MTRIYILICFCLSISLSLKAQLRLPRLVRDSMVLQRDAKINIWGWASKGEPVAVKFGGKTYKTRAGEDGKWKVPMVAMKAGGPYTMEIKGKGKNRIVLHDILIGDVWFCSGQSNMVHQLSLHSVYYPEVIPNANNPEIRQFWIPTLTNTQSPAEDLSAGSWKAAIPQDIGEFSAVAYFFAKDLFDKYHVPIGIINASVGGTPIEAWISEDGFKGFPSIVEAIEANKERPKVSRFNHPPASGKSESLDKGLSGSTPWFSTAFIPKGWRQIGIPGYWEDQGVRNLNGVVWYRKEIEVPESMAGKSAKVYLGRIVDADELYINGKRVGNTGYQYPQRRYTVPAGLLKAGKNLFVIRVTNQSGKGGFVPDKPYYIFSGEDTIDLKGYWTYKVGEVFVPKRNEKRMFSFSAQNAPTALYNAMVAPEIGYTIKGFVWYQGESNTGNAQEYGQLLPALIADWREKWDMGDIPFLYVQLPGFGDFNYLPTESNWAELRESQRKSLSVPNTAMAVAIDLGEWNDIHPDRKKPVGKRLALAAEKIAYGADIVYAGPVARFSKMEGSKVRISFTSIGGGLITSDGEELQEFAIAGADKNFVWAHAKIEGSQVLLWNEKVKDPKFVRYAWSDNPVDPNLSNKEGLPASPFEMECE